MQVLKTNLGSPRWEPRPVKLVLVPGWAAVHLWADKRTFNKGEDFSAPALFMAKLPWTGGGTVTTNLDEERVSGGSHSSFNRLMLLRVGGDRICI